MQLTRQDQGGKTGFGKVFAYLRDRLLDGSVRPGDRLIAERELSVQLGVGRPVLREALRALAMIGVVEIRPGLGTVVRQPDGAILGEFFAFALGQHSDVLSDVMQARIAIETQAARLGCTRATQADHDRLRSALDRVVATIDEPLAGGQADFDFHLSLVAASHSDTLLGIYQAIADLLSRSHVQRRGLVQFSPGMRDYLIQDHRRVFDALVSRDPDRADETLRRHFAIGDEFRQRGVIEAARQANGTPHRRDN